MNLFEYLSGILKGVERIDRFSVRAKSPNRFIEKAKKKNIDGDLKYNDPINQIQDQIGARIVTFYLKDIERVSDHVAEYFRPIEIIDIVPDSDSEFGYFGKHFIFFIPEDIKNGNPPDNSPNFFELQIKTLFQHAWGEANHDLGYKPITELSKEDKRYIAYTSAQAWGADKIFNDLYEKHNGKFIA